MREVFSRSSKCSCAARRSLSLRPCRRHTQFASGLKSALHTQTEGHVFGPLVRQKAFAEMEQMGWIGPKRPRMVTVQASGCAPIVRAFDEGKRFADEFPNAETVASGLRVPKAIGDFLILDAIRASRGTALAAPAAASCPATGSRCLAASRAQAASWRRCR